MHMRMILFIVAVIFPVLITANIWDNLFLGQGVSFRLPEDFLMNLEIQQDFGKVTFELTGSSTLNSLSIVQGVELKDAGFVVNFMTSKLLTYKLNFTAGTLNVNSPLKSCIAVQDHKFEADFYKAIQEFIDIGTLLVSREEEGGFYKLEAKKLVEMLNIKKLKQFNLKDLPLDQLPVEELPIDKIDLEKLDPNNIAENYAKKIPELVLYFDKQNHNLKKIQVALVSGEKYSLNVVEIQAYKPRFNDLAVPESWGCHKEQAKPLHEMNFQEIIKEITDPANPNFALISPFLPKDWVLPDLNSLLNQFQELLGSSSGKK